MWCTGQKLAWYTAIDGPYNRSSFKNIIAKSNILQMNKGHTFSVGLSMYILKI